MTLTYRWVDLNREPTQPPNPAYPNGKPIDARFNDGGSSCTVELPHPTPRCGLYMVACDQCRLTISITTAGRPDDPSSLTVSCQTKRAP